MVTGQLSGAVTLLQDGHVLVAGGLGSNSGPTNYTAAELYDPTTGKFTSTGSLTQGRYGHAATTLSDGRVLISGGRDASNNAMATAELYDSVTGKFSPTASMTIARSEHTATLLGNGRVLITGGGPDGPAELYDPTAGSFTTTGSLTDYRYAATATLLKDGRVLVAGGLVVPGQDVVSAELYQQ
jgi:hypothetical protein